MDFGVLEFVLVLAVEDDAVVVHEVEDADTPQGAVQELQQELVLPFLG